MLTALVLLVAALLLLLFNGKWRGRIKQPLQIALIVLTLLVSAILVYLVTSDFLAIDRCLDRGGTWNYETRTCAED